MRKTIFSIIFTVLSVFSCTAQSKDLFSQEEGTIDWSLPFNNPKIPIGMNVGDLNYYTPELVFTDVMTTAREMFTTYADGSFNSGRIDEITRDGNGYPTTLPQRTSDGKQTYVRFMINQYYKGKYCILFDGAGTLGGGAYQQNGKYYVNLSGNGENQWIDIVTSEKGNHVRNIRILPLAYENGMHYPTFLSDYLDGLRPFHAIRFMDWIQANDSQQIHWSDRVTPAYCTQGGSKGTAFEYAIELCNELQSDAWVCIPHQASDDYIRQMARLWRDTLKPGLKIYLEYSNEIWNFAFKQAHYVRDNAPGAVDHYVSESLAAISKKPDMYPEKDAFMMARVFRIWSEEFGDTGRQRLVKVATGQHAGAGNSERILSFLKNRAGVNAQCDALAVAGYFSYGKEDHDRWMKKADSVTPDDICDATLANFPTSQKWTRESAAVARKYGVDFLVYEGGQHVASHRQEEWPYSESMYEAQVQYKMFVLYIKNFFLHVEKDVNCKLFMAYAYISPRKSKYGSWGHLERLSQIGSDYMRTAPKYQALLDCNTVKQP